MIVYQVIGLSIYVNARAEFFPLCLESRLSYFFSFLRVLHILIYADASGEDHQVNSNNYHDSMSKECKHQYLPKY